MTYAKARERGASKEDAGKASKAASRRPSGHRGTCSEPRREGIAATPLYDVQTAYNGIAVQAEAGAADELAALPGVKAVHAIPLVSLENHSSVPLIGGRRRGVPLGRPARG